MTTVNFDINNYISKHHPVFYSMAEKNNISQFVLKGGRSSFKTYDMCSACILDIILHANKNQICNIIVFMNEATEIRDGIRRNFENVIKDLNMESLFRFRMNPMDITFYNGSKIIFYGLNGKEGKGKKGNGISDIGVIWFEEFDQFKSASLIDQTIDSFERNGIKGERIKYLYTFNPPQSKHHWVFDYINKLKGLNAEVIHTTYLDNDTGKQLLRPQQLERIENAKKTDPSWYSWNYLGIVPSDAEVDFPSLVRPNDDFHLDEDDYIYAGVDSATRGVDSTVLCLLSHNRRTGIIKFLGFQRFNDEWHDGYTSLKVGADIADFCYANNVNQVYVDPMQGQHIIDYLMINAPSIGCEPVNFGGKVSEYARGKATLAQNRRAEMYVNASEQLRGHNVYNYGDDMALELERQLDATELLIDSRHILVIPKTTIKERVGHSPDEADSFVLAMQSLYEGERL